MARIKIKDLSIDAKIRKDEPKTGPEVSCILATANRKPFLRQAIKYFLRQSYENRELIIVDNGYEPVEDIVPDNPCIRYLRLKTSSTLGANLNFGVEASSGTIIQKLDDDDYYHPEFLTTTVNALRAHDPECSIVGFDCFLVFIAATGKLHFSGHGFFAGATLCFHRELWKKHAFREITCGEDVWFLKDHVPVRVKVKMPELFIHVRHHSGHAWARRGNVDVTDYFSQTPVYRKPLNALIPAKDLGFYEKLRLQARESGKEVPK